MRAVAAARSAWRQPAAGLARGLRRTAMFAAVAGAAASPLIVLTLIGLGALAQPRAAVAVAPGVSHDGLPLPGAEPRSTLAAWAGGAPPPPVAAAVSDGDRLALRQGCVWGQPGRNPYRGSTEQALEAAGLPPEVVRQVAALRQAGRPSDRLEIRTGAIRALRDDRHFDPRAVALSFGRTMCLGSRVNFVAGHVEQADLYEVRDAQGQRHSVMVPDVCGNVSVLAVQGERSLLQGLSAVLARRSADAAAIAAALLDPSGEGAAAAGPAAPAPRGGGRQPSIDALEDARVADPSRPWPVASQRAAGPAGQAIAQGMALPAGRVGDAARPAVAGARDGAGPARPAATTPRSGGEVIAATDRPAAPLPRRIAAAALNGLSDQLAHQRDVVDTLAGKPGPGSPSAREVVADKGVPRYEVAEPGTLACVLLGLAGLAGIRRRRGR